MFRWFLIFLTIFLIAGGDEQGQEDEEPPEHGAGLCGRGA